jgi:soluble lytic murein transglycosylase-like protein
MGKNLALEKLCQRFGCDPELVSAIVTIESSWNPYAVRYEPTYKWLHEPQVHAKRHGITLQTEAVLQRCSWGLMQVIGSTSRELGLVLPIPALCEPLIGLEYGIRYLVALKRNYKKQDDIIAAYNAGTAKKNADGKYLNQSYVDKVNKVIKEFD